MDSAAGRDDQHSTYDADQAATYFPAATDAALVLADLRSAFPGPRRRQRLRAPSTSRSTSSRDSRPIRLPTTSSCATEGTPAGVDRLVAGGSERRAGRFFAFAYPATDGFGDADLSRAAGRWDAKLGEYVLDWDDIRESPTRRRGGRIRPRRLPPRLRGVRVGTRSRGHCRGSSAPIRSGPRATRFATEPAPVRRDRLCRAGFQLDLEPEPVADAPGPSDPGRDHVQRGGHDHRFESWSDAPHRLLSHWQSPSPQGGGEISRGYRPGQGRRSRRFRGT